MGLDPHQVHEPLLLLEGHVLLVPLHKREQALVPEDGQGAGVGDKVYKVGEHSVDHVIRGGVLLVQECPQEDAVGSAVLHLGNLEDGRARVEHGDAGLGQGAGDDEGLAEGAASAPAEGQEDALEEGGRLEEGLLEGHVQVQVEARTRLCCRGCEGGGPGCRSSGPWTRSGWRRRSWWPETWLLPSSFRASAW